jgi:hypothetical protein
METLYSRKKVALKILEVTKIVKIAKVNHHLKCNFEDHQTYPQESKVVECNYPM